MHVLSDTLFTAYIGIDWADSKHDACLQAAGSEQREFTSFSHQVDSIEAWAHSMHQRFGGPIAVVLELSKGPIVYALQKYAFFVLFPVNPSMVGAAENTAYSVPETSAGSLPNQRHVNHEMENGTEAYTELSYYEASTNLVRHPSASLTGVEMVIGAQNYYNPFGPCDSPNRVEGLPLSDVPCEGIPIKEDFYRWVEYPRIVDNTAKTWRVLQGFRGSAGDWDWDTALVVSNARRSDITHNRISNNLMTEALNDPTPAAYNPFAAGEPGIAEGTNIERALIDVYRENKTDLRLLEKSGGRSGDYRAEAD